MFKKIEQVPPSNDNKLEPQMEIEIITKQISDLEERKNNLESDIIKKEGNIEKFRKQSIFFQRRIDKLKKRRLEIEESLL